MHQKFTRRQVLIGGGILAGAAATASASGLIPGTGASRVVATTPVAGSPTPTTSPEPAAGGLLHTRPDFAIVPTAEVTTATGSAADGYLFVAPRLSDKVRGPAIFTNDGRLVFYQPVELALAHNFQVVEYQGERMVAWYEGASRSVYGRGSYVIYNDRYELVARIFGDGGAPIDMHELVVTPEGTALVCAYEEVRKDLTAYGGLKDAVVYDWRLQEIDIATGELLFSWRALDHVAYAESVTAIPVKEGVAFDYFHGNSIEVTPDGDHLVISARNTSTIYKIDRKTGDIVWRLRGADDDLNPDNALTLTPSDESFWFQHDARVLPGGRLSLFDDGGQPFHHNARGMVFAIDEEAGTAELVRSDTVDIAVGFMGSYRSEAGGEWLAGWGNIPRLTEFDGDGDVSLDIKLNGYSYRALRFDWQATPSTPPDIAVQDNQDGTVTLWASWNGATEVATWRVLAGADAESLAAVETFARERFETEMTVATHQPFVAVEALDADGEVLGTSPVAALSALTNRGRVPMLSRAR